MTRASAILVVALALLLGCGRDPIVGRWEGKSVFGADLALTFQSDGRLTVTFLKDGHTNHGKYWLDVSPTPHHFDYELQGRGRIRTILEFVDRDTIAFEEVASSGDPRPTQFGRHRLVFRRK